MNTIIYRHYGTNSFKKEKFHPISNYTLCNKPLGGFWASPKDDNYSWFEWCKEEMPYRLSCQYIDFKLSENAKILHIYNKKDIKKLPILKNKELYFNNPIIKTYFDFVKLKENGYDGLEIHNFYELNEYFHYWDCNSIVIFNPEIVIPIN